MLLISLALAADVPVTDVDTLRAAVASAAPGDRILLSMGTFRLDDTLTLAAAGTPEAPIELVGDGAVILVDTVEGIKISGPHWHLSGLSMRGVCASDDDCEHALHIVGAADGTVVRGCAMVDFNAQIKGNGEEIGGAYAWPDDVVIEGNDLHDTRARSTGNPVTKIDVVGGRRWRVEANRIADFQKGGGDGVSYAAFLKGNSKDGVFARNLVVCSERFEGGTRVGLSLGGGGTSPDSICEDGTCTPEHERGLIVNNIIAGCSDVGVYLNEAADSAVVANLLFATSGIDVRFEASVVSLTNNVLDGAIRERDGGSATLGTNWAGLDFADVYVDPGALDFTLLHDPGLLDGGDPVEGLVDDFCGHTRNAAPDGGALEYLTPTPCDTTVVHPDTSGGDTGDTGTDGGDTGDTDGGDTEGGDTGTDSGGSGDTGGGPKDADSACGCASGGGGAGWAWVVALVVGIRGRARARGGPPQPHVPPVRRG